MDSQTYYAQYGEDRILNRIFNKQTGCCVEVGGFDGVTGSNTYFFERLGWNCLVVEPMPEFCRKIKAARSCEVAEIAASDKVGEVEFYVAVGVETLLTMEKSAGHFARIKGLCQQEVEKITVKTARLDDILRERGMQTPRSPAVGDSRHSRIQLFQPHPGYFSPFSDGGYPACHP